MILQTGGKQLISDSVVVYTARRRESMRLEPPNFNRDATHTAWDPEGRVLSVATAKGNLLPVRQPLRKDDERAPETHETRDVRCVERGRAPRDGRGR